MLSYNRFLSYVPHGINEELFYPITDDPEYDKFVSDYKSKTGGEFFIFWTNRNIRRKRPSDVILAFKLFCDMLPKEEALKLIDKFENYSFIDIDKKISGFESVKQCAIIAVDEMLEEYFDCFMFSKCDYWLKVKEELLML